MGLSDKNSLPHSTEPYNNTIPGAIRPDPPRSPTPESAKFCGHCRAPMRPYPAAYTNGWIHEHGGVYCRTTMADIGEMEYHHPFIGTNLSAPCSYCGKMGWDKCTGPKGSTDE